MTVPEGFYRREGLKEKAEEQKVSRFVMEPTGGCPEMVYLYGQCCDMTKTRTAEVTCAHILPTAAVMLGL